MKYIIGVDAGGTKTIAVVYSPEGQRLAAFSAGPGNVTAGGDGAAQNICRAVQGCMESQGGQCLFVGVGMAGLDPATTPQIMRALLKERFAVESTVVDDGTLALYAAHGGGDGLLVIAGTGSITYGMRGGTVLRRGGWGHVLGDRGSGYAIAADAIRLALLDQDNGLPECALTQGLLEHIGSQRLRSLVELAYSRPKDETAALSRVVADLCRKGDSRACALLRQAGEELAGMAMALAGRLGLADPGVALMGGILESIEPVRQAFSARLLGNMPGAVIQTEPVEPQRGALCLFDKVRK